MNRIDFYILRDDTEQARWQFVARLADKARRLGHRVLVRVDSRDQASALDEFLWSSPEEGFLPHRLLDDEQEPPAPVEIAAGDSVGEHRDVLINLGSSVPTELARFERLAEVVIQTPEILTNTREHFSFYKSQGYAVNHQKL